MTFIDDLLAYKIDPKIYIVRLRGMAMSFLVGTACVHLFQVDLLQEMK